MFEERIDSEAEFRKFAVRERAKYEKIQIRVTENLLVNKFFVDLYRWCKDFPGGGWSHSKYFVTKDREVALKLRDLEKGGSK
ncbi:MAG: hypothetical protein M1470_00435 [Bacteroidetes bacterium]|nr:hypothetical protein [Bacteroidota bacterium]MCL5737217.1 hypothetical protein [Bacteroidota bacterium]